MMATHAPTQFPAYLNDVERLVEKHRQLTDEPLVLAIYYKPDRDEQDIFLFEVIENFGGGSVDPDRELFEVTYHSANGFPLEPGQRLHLVMTNPHEFTEAVRQNWNLMAELRGVIQSGNFRTVHCDPKHRHLLELVNA